MKLRKYLNESFLTYIKSSFGGEPYEVFVNPSKREIYKFDTIRFVLDNKTKKMYAWDGELGIHGDTWDSIEKLPEFNKIAKGKCIYSDYPLLAGVAIKKGGKFVYSYSDTVDRGNRKNIDWTWAKYYISGLEKVKIDKGAGH